MSSNEFVYLGRIIMLTHVAMSRVAFAWIEVESRHILLASLNTNHMEHT